MWQIHALLARDLIAQRQDEADRIRLAHAARRRPMPSGAGRRPQVAERPATNVARPA